MICGILRRLGFMVLSDMAFDGTNVHVLGLNPRDQFLIRLVLTNLLAGYIDKSIQEASTMSSQDGADQRASQTIGLFMRYCDFADMLCPEGMLGRARPKVLMIKPQMMKYIVMAFNAYDHYNNYLSIEHRAILAATFEPLRKKIADSAQFTYDRYEIEMAKK